MADEKQDSAPAPDTRPLHEQYLARLKAHKTVAVLIVIGTIVTGLASFTDAAGKLAAIFHRQRPEDARQELARLGVPFTPEAFSDVAGKGDLTVVKLFLASGMAVDRVPEEEVPVALVAATRDNQPKVVEVLLKAGADPGVQLGGFLSALELAAHGGNQALFTQLAAGRPLTPAVLDAAFLQAAEGAQPEMLAFLQARGADARRLATATLTEAVSEGRANDKGMAGAAEFLLRAGADIEARTGDDGWTPLHFASYRGAPDLVRVLLDHGATVDPRDRNGRTPLWWAAGVGRFEPAELLLAKGADAKSRDKEGTTVMGRARYNRDERMARLLRDHGAR